MFPRHLIRSWAKHAQAWQAHNSISRRGLSSNHITWQPARNISAAAAAGAGAAAGAMGFLSRAAWNARLALGIAGGAAGTAAWKWRGDHDNVGPLDTQDIAWVQELAGQPGMKEMLVPGQMLRKHPVGQLLAEDDHLVSNPLCEAGHRLRTQQQSPADQAASSTQQEIGMRSDSGQSSWQVVQQKAASGTDRRRSRVTV
eukprot:GHRQ01027826.1.p1 GENE.GHRQ01027826.1~~GHRQ01027826.1.p1  ORF type:complete len:199 (+),score=58.88 GHRQ01027826.1:332-928(+)